LAVNGVSARFESGILAAIDSLADEMFMRGFFPLLLCAALFPFSVQAEDAPLPFDVPSAAPVIQRTAVVSKPVAYRPVAQQPAVQPVKSHRNKRSAQATRAKKPSAVAKKQKGTRPAAVKKTKQIRSAAVVNKKSTKVSQKRSTVKPKGAVPKKQPTHKKQSTVKKH
jgi:hypothetical protein